MQRVQRNTQKKVSLLSNCRLSPEATTACPSRLSLSHPLPSFLSLFKYHLIERPFITLPKIAIPIILSPVPALIFLIVLTNSSPYRVML